MLERTALQSPRDSRPAAFSQLMKIPERPASLRRYPRGRIPAPESAIAEPTRCATCPSCDPAARLSPDRMICAVPDVATRLTTACPTVDLAAADMATPAPASTPPAFHRRSQHARYAIPVGLRAPPPPHLRRPLRLRRRCHRLRRRPRSLPPDPQTQPLRPSAPYRPLRRSRCRPLPPAKVTRGIAVG